MEIVKVPYNKLNEYAELNVCSILSESDKIAKGFVFRFRNKLWICSGSVSYKHKYEKIEINELVHISNYTGKLKPLTRGDHWREVDEGKRERGYIGRLVSYDGKKYVVVSKLQLEPIKGEEEEGQLALF